MTSLGQPKTSATKNFSLSLSLNTSSSYHTHNIQAAEEELDDLLDGLDDDLEGETMELSYSIPTNDIKTEQPEPEIDLLAAKKKKKVVVAVDHTVAQIIEKEELSDDLELVAVITAAIAAGTGASTDGFVVRSIKRVKTNQWQKA